MTTFFAALLGLLVWMALGVFVAFCVSAGNGDVGDAAPLSNVMRWQKRKIFRLFNDRRRNNGY